MLDNLCPPAVLYLGFSLIQIIIDIFKNMYNTAIMKFIVMIVFTIILNILCSSGLSVISWMIVFIPFIMMTILTSLLLFVFGLSPSSGKLDYKVEYPGNKKTNVNSVYVTHGDENIMNSKTDDVNSNADKTDTSSTEMKKNT
jgi:hypothetical protein